MTRSSTGAPGMVYLVGAGPGDPGLITLRGVECLRRADLVLYDYLVNPRTLRHARGDAQLVCLGRHGQDRLMPQSEVCERMVAAARAGQCVVRLKGGDPAVFARTAEETAALAAAGVRYEVVPGVTAALAVAGYAGVPLTHRDAASAVALVTGRECDDKSSPLDYRRLGAFPGTLVFYMGVTTAPQWAKELMAGGKPAGTPVAIIRRCTWPDQETLRCTLGEAANVLKERKLRPPVVIVIGEAVDLASASTWFTARPLFGTRILVTRPAGQSAGLRDQLEELGAEVYEQPAIEIRPPADWTPVDAALAELDSYDWLVFSSANGVQALLDRLFHLGHDLRRLGRIRLAAIGPGTAAELGRYHMTADRQPDEFRAESLSAALTDEAPGKRFLLARASRGREVLAEQLHAAGGHVDQIVVYTSRDVAAAEPAIAARVRAGQVDWITVTSSAIAHSLAAMFGDDLSRSRLASISPITSATLRQLGHDPAVEAEEYTMSGVVRAIVERCRE